MIQKESLKCIWSGKKSERVKPVTLKTLNRITSPTEKTFYVLPEHEQKLRNFNHEFVQNGKMFLMIILSITFLMAFVALMAAFLPGSENILISIVGISVSSIGITLVKYPFATPETVQLFGIKKSVQIVKISGYIITLIGLFFTFYPYFNF